jgi:hypothetical protein
MSQCGVELVWQVEASSFSSEVTRELAAEGSTG